MSANSSWNPRGSPEVRLKKILAKSSCNLTSCTILNKPLSPEVRIHRIERVGDLPGMMMYPAHIQILPDPLDLALTALNSYRHTQLNLANQQQIPTPRTYTLESWQEFWQRGYNWYWHHLSPDGVDDSSLNQEKQNFDISIALNNDGFKKRFSWAAGDIGLQTLAVFNPLSAPRTVTKGRKWIPHLI